MSFAVDSISDLKSIVEGKTYVKTQASPTDCGESLKIISFGFSDSSKGEFVISPPDGKSNQTFKYSSGNGKDTFFFKGKGSGLGSTKMASFRGDQAQKLQITSKAGLFGKSKKSVPLCEYEYNQAKAIVDLITKNGRYGLEAPKNGQAAQDPKCPPTMEIYLENNSLKVKGQALLHIKTKSAPGSVVEFKETTASDGSGNLVYQLSEKVTDKDLVAWTYLLRASGDLLDFAAYKRPNENVDPILHRMCKYMRELRPF